MENAFFDPAAPAPVVVKLPDGFEIVLLRGYLSDYQAPVRPQDPGAAVLRLAVTDVVRWAASRVCMLLVILTTPDIYVEGEALLSVRSRTLVLVCVRPPVMCSCC